MTTLVIIIKQEALISTGAHKELLQDFLSLFVHVKKIFGHSKKIQNKKWWYGTDHSVILLKDTSRHLLDAPESTCRLRPLELKRAEWCVDFSAVFTSIKTERYVNLLLKRQQWTLESKESKCCDARKTNSQRKPINRDWQPLLRRSRVDLLVATSQLKGWSN